MPQVHRRLDVLKAEVPRAGVQPQLPSRTPAAATERHPLVRDGLKAALAALPGVQVVAEAATGQAAVREALLHQPDVVVMDLQMPEGNGIEATRQLGRALPSAAVLVLTMFDDDDSVFAAMRAGARGYVLKGAEQDEIARAITAVAAGEAIFGPAVATRVLAYFTTPHGLLAHSRS